MGIMWGIMKRFPQNKGVEPHLQKEGYPTIYSGSKKNNSNILYLYVDEVPEV